MALTLKKAGRRIPPVDLLISNLMLANLFSVFTRFTPVLVHQAWSHGSARPGFCKLFGFFSILSGSMSAWLTALLSAFRISKFCANRPLLQGTKIVKISVGTTWITWGVLLSPTLMYLDKAMGCWDQASPRNESCGNGSSSLQNIRSFYGCTLAIGHRGIDKVYIYVCLVLTEILPAAIMLLAGTATLWALKKYIKERSQPGRLPSAPMKINNWVGPAPRYRPKAHWWAGWLVLALMCTYLVCWVTHFTVLAISFSNDYELDQGLIEVGRIAYAIYPVLCPYALGLGSRRFRKALWNSMNCI
ncbi:olfactory receptor class A-like protein 4 [Ambystoma mexicanum]|uniref:olfactory receptor class A-like protein 4 n=1 Tax=Ambystoma mexicanum TaxID=8296 RepID=UPI0037E93C94